jgi:hypothetical protein
MTDGMRKMRKEFSLLDRAEEKLKRGEMPEKVLQDLRITEDEFRGVFDRYAAPPNLGESLNESGLLDSVFPIFVAADVDGPLEQIGSGVAVAVGDDLFALTAAHVTDRSKDGVLFMPGVEGITPVSGGLAFTELPNGDSRQSDRGDMAYYRLSKHLRASLDPSIKPVAIDQLLLTDSVETGYLFTFVGYPWRKARRRGQTHEGERVTYTGHALPPAIYNRLGYSRLANVLIRMRRDKTYSTLYKSRATAPHPQGISGGAVIAWPSTYQKRVESPRLKLAAIGHTYHAAEHCLAATRVISYMMGIIRNNGHLAASFGSCEEVCHEFAEFLESRTMGNELSSVSKVVGIGWYKREAYQRCLSIFDDRTDLPNTFEEWLPLAERAERQLRNGGINVIRVDIDPSTFPKWCKQNGFLRIDRHTRMAYGNIKAYESFVRRTSSA